MQAAGGGTKLRAALALGLMVIASSQLAATGGQASLRGPSHGDGSLELVGSGLEWRPLGPWESGLVLAVAGSSARPLEYGLSSAGGGVWTSADGATPWLPPSETIALGTGAAPAVAVDQPDLVAATHERATGRRPDIGVPRQSTAGQPMTRLEVVPPPPAVLPDHPVQIDYLLGEDAPTVTIEIRDADGTLVRRFVGGTAGPADPAPETRAPAAVRNVAGPGTRRGVNRFSWDLRAEGPLFADAVEPDADLADVQPGPRVAPGTYTVKVEALGQAVERPCEVRGRPAAGAVGGADLQAAYRFALEVRDRLDAAQLAAERVADLERQIRERVPEARAPVISLAAEATLRVLSEVAEALGRLTGARRASDASTPLIARLVALYRASTTADAPPSDSTRLHFTQLTAELDSWLERLRSVEANHVAAFNRLLTNGGLAPVAPGPSRLRRP